MEEYKSLYYKLFNKLTDIKNEIERVQSEVEEEFILQGEGETDKEKEGT